MPELTRYERMEAYYEVKERFGLRAKQRDQLDVSAWYDEILEAAHAEEWTAAEAALREAGIL